MYKLRRERSSAVGSKCIRCQHSDQSVWIWLLHLRKTLRNRAHRVDISAFEDALTSYHSKMLHPCIWSVVLWGSELRAIRGGADDLVGTIMRTQGEYIAIAYTCFLHLTKTTFVYVELEFGVRSQLGVWNQLGVWSHLGFGVTLVLELGIRCRGAVSCYTHVACKTSQHEQWHLRLSPGESIELIYMIDSAIKSVLCSM